MRDPGRAASALLIAATLRACTSSGGEARSDLVPSRPGSPQPDATTPSCYATVGETTDIDEGAQAVLGTVGLPLGDAGWTAAGSSADAGVSRRLFFKQGLNTRNEKHSVISVDPAAPGRPLIGWGIDAPAPAMTAPACPRQTEGRKWRVYAGGIYLDGFACVTVTVRSGGRTAEVRIPLGAPCGP